MTKKDQRDAGPGFASEKCEDLKEFSREIRAQDLRQLYYLKKEIKEQQRRIEELENLATKCTTTITGMPHGRGVSDKVGEYSVQLSDLKNLLELNIEKCFFELDKLDRCIQNVDDSLVRQIMTYRFVHGFSWVKISHVLGGYNSVDSLKKKLYRFLKNN